MTGTQKSPGQVAYEASLVQHPTYHNGSPRRTWDELNEISRSSWEHQLVAADMQKIGVHT